MACCCFGSAAPGLVPVGTLASTGMGCSCMPDGTLKSTRGSRFVLFTAITYLPNASRTNERTMPADNGYKTRNLIYTKGPSKKL